MCIARFLLDMGLLAWIRNCDCNPVWESVVHSIILYSDQNSGCTIHKELRENDVRRDVWFHMRWIGLDKVNAKREPRKDMIAPDTCKLFSPVINIRP